jgi:NhaP-type Na+/H+ or K+/H+ antiporter
VLDGAPWSVPVFAVLALTVGRMVPVAVALAGTGLSRPTVAFLGWFGPRGIATVVFALIAYDEFGPGDTRATMLAAIVATVLLSVAAHALTARPLAGRYAAHVARTGRAAYDPGHADDPSHADDDDHPDDPEGDASAETIGVGP